MAARKLAQEVDKCFKKVQEGVAEFESIYEKIEQSNNPAQKEKLEDQLKREIKKLQRLRDQIKTWAASNDIKDKAPLLENRRLIETQMEKFKAVEKAMKTKAYSKEGLSAAAKLDPKEQAKMVASEFLSNMVDDLEQQIETLEAEGEAIQATMKKGKGQSAKVDRMAAIERIIERHKWHQGKLELIRRSLENGGVETDQVTDLEESIKYYVQEGMQDDFMEDDTMYDDLNLQEEEDVFGMTQETDRVSSQDTQSIQDDLDSETRVTKQRTPTDGPGAGASVGASATSASAAAAAVAAAAAAAGRRPSAQLTVPLKSPMPTLATVHNPLSNAANGAPSNPPMKSAPIPPRQPGEGMKWASAAAAAAASANNVGIAPLPPPPPATPSVGVSSLPPGQQFRTSTASSPSTASVQLSSHSGAALPQADKPAAALVPPPTSASSAAGSLSKAETAKAGPSRSKAPPEPAEFSKAPQQPNGTANGIQPIEEEQEEESIYHLPASLQDLMDSFEVTKKRPAPPNSPPVLRMQTASNSTRPDATDADAPRHYHPDVRFYSSSHFPQEPLAIFEDPRLYSRIEPDTLFYVFYYKQGSYQQYLAAKALKDQSWRFHKQYQTWFQRHEEPKSITEEFEQGTYRFFDYESTWMNRRKADFKFAYKFLEDDV